MYALICLFTIIGVTWMAFLYRILKNLQRGNEDKAHNQIFHNYKIDKLYGEIEETEKGEKAEKTGT